MRLHENMRVRQGGSINAAAEQYAAWLLQLGNGGIPHASSQTDPSLIQLPPSLCMPAYVPLLLHWTFPNLEARYTDRVWLSTRCILAAKNVDVEAINTACLQCIPAAPWICYSADAIIDDDNQVGVPPEYLNTLMPSGTPPHKLILKKGIPVILLHNLNPYRGTRLFVINMYDGRLLEAANIGGQFDGDVVLIPRIACYPKDGDFLFEWRRRQFPVRLCFAMTINKSQGQTLQRAGICFPEDVFAHGQLYVAASRVLHPDNIRFALKHSPRSSVTTNIVYQDVIN